MNAKDCSNKSRKGIKEPVKQELLRHAGFCCSICGGIPIVYHHIEEWSKKFSNDKRYIIPICDRCHKNIHGSGGPILTKKELYSYKLNPNIKTLLKYKYPLERKQNYSFFIGSNFVANGEKATLFMFDKHPLTTIDTSAGILKLSILFSIKNNKPHYLIKDNELTINTEDIWGMNFSGPTLKIWKKSEDKKIVLIDLVIKSNIIIIRSMHTEFNGMPFSIYKLRSPREHQLRKISTLIKQCERHYRKLSKLIDKQRGIVSTSNGVNLNKLIKDGSKAQIKHEIELKLNTVLQQEFKWDQSYTWRILNKELESSPIFRKGKSPISMKINTELSKTIRNLKSRHKTVFKDLDNTVAKYNGMVLMNNFML